MGFFNYIWKKIEKRSTSNMSHDSTLSFDMGFLIPILTEMCIPNQTWSIENKTTVRLEPQIAPFFNNLWLEEFTFFVPFRIIFDEYESFMYGGRDGLANIPHPVVSLDAVESAPGSLADYLGLASMDSDREDVIEVNALPFRAYNKIFNDWFRNETLIEEVPISKGSGRDAETNKSLLRSMWNKDKFTTALPFSQRGDVVRIGLTGNANVINSQDNIINGQLFSNQAGTTGRMVSQNPQIASAGRPSVGVNGSLRGVDAPIHLGDANGQNTGLEADMSDVSSISIPELRLANKLQEWQERNATYGYRTAEATASHFGIRPNDARLQRAELISTSISPIITSEVIQSSQSTQDSPQGNMAGHSFGLMYTKKRKYRTTEHGILMKILRLQPRTAYVQASKSWWWNKTRFDYPFPEFQHIGEEPILKKHLNINSTDPDGIFGYNQRYIDYRHSYNEIHGLFRSSLNFWHQGRILPNDVSLNADFVKSQPSNRIFAVEQGNTQRVYAYIEFTNFVKSPLSRYGLPRGGY